MSVDDETSTIADKHLFMRSKLLYEADKNLGSKLAKNIDFKLVRRISSDRVITNDRGWRVRYPSSPSGKRDIAVLGCSWAMGVGGDFDKSIVGFLEDSSNFSIANLGVGSYSLLQSVRLYQNEAHVIKPKKILLLFGSWMVDRCLKERSSAMIYRPIFVKNKRSNDLKTLASNNPPTILIEHYKYLSQIKCNLTSRGKNMFSSFISLYMSLIERLGAVFHLRSRILRKLFGFRSFLRLSCNDKENRKKILLYCLKELESTAKQFSSEIIIYHLFPYKSISSRRSFLEIDHQILSDFVMRSKEIKYIPYDNMENALNIYFEDNQLSYCEGVEKIHWDDNNHPKPIGYRLIAGAVSQHLL